MAAIPLTRRPRTGKRVMCSRGCGRIIQDREGECVYCQKGLPPPEALPHLHTTEYLERCVEELTRRFERARAVIERFKGAA